MGTLKEKIKAVKCAFTLDVAGDFSPDRLRQIKPLLESEIKDLETVKQRYEYDDEELCQALDLLTFVESKVGSKRIALEINEKAMEFSKNCFTPLFSRGNRIYLLWKAGDYSQIKADLMELDKIRENASQRATATIKARQAYCYLRLGGPKNLKEAITLYEEALEIFPGMHLWRLQAARVYRRISHPNMFGKNNINLKLKSERERKADEFCHLVTRRSQNPRLQAFAFADLAVGVFSRKEVNDNLADFCREALRLCGNHPYVLVNCGKSLQFKDTKMAVELLTKATEISPTSHTFDQLGKCLNRFALRQKNIPALSEDLAKEAERSYHQALLLSPYNIPARYSLGRLLRCRGKAEMALSEFMKIISAYEYDNYALTLMKTYEQASLCLLELYPDDVYTPSCTDNATIVNPKDDAEEMLIKALSIAFKLLSQREIQTSFRELLSLLENITDTKDTPEALLFLTKAYRLAKDPEKSLKAVEKHFEITTSEDAVVMTSAIKAYLDLGRFEDAFALMNRSIACCEATTIDDSLYNKVALSAARSRLLHYGGDAPFVFQSVFDSYRLTRHGLGTSGEARELSHAACPEEEMSDSCDKLDVLIVYDDSRDGAEELSPLKDICSKVQRLMKKVFGLNVSINLHRCCAGIPEAFALLDEMTKAELVLVVFGPEKLDGEFENLLKFLPNVMIKSEENRNPPQVFVAVTEDRVRLPSAVRQCQKIQISDVVESLNVFEELHPQRQRDDLYGVINNESVTACVENMMSFFCSLLSINWPFTTEES
ncbi:hypothetical protein PoB_000942400 [Plakobranchus ocellatus]|uniref:Cell division cycle protein 27 homolog n=1 Tax=Plakobranchus ocellatus TaxID=259542 RepID=A0AAV3YIT1_9GAST|nr:hypothetical protein PoB_000942400 [Plakobranchus ocellatus]